MATQIFFSVHPDFLGKIPIFDSYFSKGLKPPTSHPKIRPETSKSSENFQRQKSENLSMFFSSKHQATEPQFPSNFREGVKTLTLAFALLFAVLYDAWRDGFFAYFFQ